MQHSKDLRVDEIFEMTAPRPAMGNWYCVITCNCGKSTPLCDDPSKGKAALKLVGKGGFRVNCWACGNEAKGTLNSVRTLQWTLPT